MPYYEFTGKGVLDPILMGVLPAIANNSGDLKRWWPQRDLPPSRPAPAVLLGGHCPADLASRRSNPCFSHDHVFASSIACFQPENLVKRRRD